MDNNQSGQPSQKQSKFKDFIEKGKEELEQERVPLTILACAVLLFVGFVYFRIDRISKMSFEEMVSFAAKKEQTKITVGIVQNGKMIYTVYGKEGRELPQTEHVYEIASITKTFTAALLFKAIDEGKAKLDDNIDKYLDLPDKSYYPTLRRLVTHTSGYVPEYSGDSKEQVLARIGQVSLKDRDYSFNYSNFGFAVVGLVLEAIYGEDYEVLINNYVKDEFGLLNTKVNDGSGDLGNYQVEKSNSGQKPAGSLTSTITDLMLYAKMQLEGTPKYLSQMHEPIVEIKAGMRESKKLNTRINAMGASWLIDTTNNIAWHDGTMGKYNSYIGFDKGRQIAVIVLINTSSDHLILTSLPASIIGAKLLAGLQKN
ncbi:MAG: beta-lactamase family protein [Eubacteriaceae bacterium]|nr:beta-lactamase family protein [Eubacteriaceae bacterium]